VLTYLHWPEPISDRYDKQQEEPPAMFEFNEPYEQTEPNVIRSDFAELIAGYHPDDLEALLFKLACNLSTDTLREFMDDLAMGRV
jgi:hypothetical protein